MHGTPRGAPTRHCRPMVRVASGSMRRTKSQQGYDPKKAIEAYKKGVAVAEAHLDSELQPVRDKLLRKIQNLEQSFR